MLNLVESQDHHHNLPRRDTQPQFDSPPPTSFSVFNVGKTVLCVPVAGGGGGGGEPFKK